MKKSICILVGVFLILTLNSFGAEKEKSQAELKLLEKKIAIDEKKLELEREKWLWERSEKERME